MNYARSKPAYKKLIMLDYETQSVMPKSLSDVKTITFADMFCGIGGFHYATQHLGLPCVFACDIDEPCRQQYQHNFGLMPQADITEIKANHVPEHDIMFAGFPCQPFSIIGSRQGIGDDRGLLFMEILRILKAKRPQAVMLENVRQFATANNGDALAQVLLGLKKIGYECDWKILNALDFGLPQKRERIIIVGLLDGLSNFSWPEKKSFQKITVRRTGSQTGKPTLRQ